MFSFRQKIFISYIGVFLLFLVLLFPFATKTVDEIVAKTMSDRADEMIIKLKEAKTDDALIRRMKELKWMIFFRVSIITDDRKVLYDSHAKKLLGPSFSQDYTLDHPEVAQAFRVGIGYYEGYSRLFKQDFAYMAKAFDFHGKTYVLRMAFPYRYIISLTRDFEIGFLGLATLVLLLFSIMTWFIINHLTNPIQQIIRAVKPYQEGTQNVIPEIRIRSSNTKDDFGKLAMTLNSLSQRIQSHINTLTMERNEKEAVLESLVEGVIAVDNSMVVQFSNAMALKFLEKDKNSILGRNFTSAEKPSWEDLLKRCQEREEVLKHSERLKIEGRTLFLDIVAAPKKAQSGAILVIQDNTSQHKIFEMRKDFIANASHELKTPITVIRGFAETLHDNPELPRQTTEEITGKIVKSCERMTTLIKDLLTLADIEHLQDSRLLPCDIIEILEACVSMLQDAHPTAEVDFNFGEAGSIAISADKQLMELALWNLLENAAKYSTPPAHITVSVEDRSEEVLITIADKGIGIPPEDVEHIFQRFYTVNRMHSKKMGGAGLGLSLVETIISKHNGKISVESEVGKGTTFTIRLPKRLSLN